MARFHLFGLANIPTRKENTWEPFTPLTFNMAKMLKDNGDHVTFYGSAGSNPPCDEFVELVPANVVAPGLELNDLGAPKAAWCNYADSPAWAAFITNGRRELRKRYREGDVSLISFGGNQRFVAEESKLHCEFCCGYSGIFSRYKVFPSHVWRHYLYGELKMETTPNWFDTVIPHYVDVNDFPYQYDKGDYLLFMGRLCQEKGPDIAVDIANRAGVKIIVAGVDQYTHTIPDWMPKGGQIEYVGYVNQEKRLELLLGARALIHPCRYLEPFGMVLIEAMACGTPIIGSNWGALTEIVEHGITGFLCEDMEEFLNAVKNIDNLSPTACRVDVETKYSLAAAYPQYSKYFRRLQKLIGGGWYEIDGTWRGPQVVEMLRKLGATDPNTAPAGAEVGVDTANLSSYLLREIPGLTLYMIDTWAVPPADSSYAKSGDAILQRSAEQRERDLLKAMSVTDQFATRRYIIREDSRAAAAKVDDESLDFVFIDADHSYEGVAADIAAWSPKVRIGGVVCGHDYGNGVEWGVARAVDEYVAAEQKKLILGNDWTWFVKI